MNQNPRVLIHVDKRGRIINAIVYSPIVMWGVIKVILWLHKWSNYSNAVLINGFIGM